MNVAITVTKQEVEAAIKDYIADRVQAGYRFESGEVSLDFHDKNGQIAYFECTADTEITPKEEQ